VSVRKHARELEDSGQESQEEESDSAQERGRLDRFQDHARDLLARFHVYLFGIPGSTHEPIV